MRTVKSPEFTRLNIRELRANNNDLSPETQENLEALQDFTQQFEAGPSRKRVRGESSVQQDSSSNLINGEDVPVVKVEDDDSEVEFVGLSPVKPMDLVDQTS